MIASANKEKPYVGSIQRIVEDERTMKKTISIVIACIVVICLAVGVGYLRLPQTRYRMYQDYASFYVVVQKKLKPGMTQREVVAMLGSGEVVTGANRDRELKNAPDMPRLYPDGLLPSDTIVSYPVGKLTYMHLYFRDGVLINFDPKRYQTPEAFNSQSSGR